ncbi:hypothetical protein [Bacillus cereus]|nr:hypothetical protein [Bacillus cereus]
MKYLSNAYEKEIDPRIGCFANACGEICGINVCGVHGCLGDFCGLNW